MNLLRKHLSAPSLLATIRQSFEAIPDPRSGATTISLPDALMSGLAVFGLKCPSLLQFDQQRGDPIVESNLHTLYGIEQVPCDTQLREILDLIAPSDLRPAFKVLFAALQRGKALEAYVYLDGYYLLSIDGTGQFASSKTSCPHCGVKTTRSGELTYYHQLLGAVLVHPAQSVVLPLAPEPILRTDGQDKNDCERNAAKRLLTDLRREHPHLPLIVVEDTLAANGPHIELLQHLDLRFILGVKPTSHDALFDQAHQALDHGQGASWEVRDPHDERILHRFEWVNDLSLNDHHPELKVQFLNYWQISPQKTQHFSWVTDLPLSQDTVWAIMKGGRCRWKIENETFNTLKNQGYHLEHNYGHGQQYLASVFAFLTMLAFLVDQIQLLCCTLFQQALHTQHSMRGLWFKMNTLFQAYLIDSWKTFFLALIHGPGRHSLQPDTS